MRLFSLASYRVKYSELGRRPRIFDLLILLPAALLNSMRNRDFSYSRYSDSLRIWRACRYPEINTLVANKPNIELLCVAAPKDFETLFCSIESAIKFSGNVIEKVTVITTSSGLNECLEILGKLGRKVNVVDEDSLLSIVDREKILKKFEGRYGWVLQQLLAVQYISTSESSGVLLLNSDTILLRPMDFLDENNNQILMVSTEFHPPYYKLLNKLIGSSVNPKWTFITHHMLFQPWILREIIQVFNVNNVSNLVNWLIMHVEPGEESPLCVEFELYAQGMLQLYPAFVKLRKFSNVSLPRTSMAIEEDQKKHTNLKVSKFNSCSYHDYI